MKFPATRASGEGIVPDMRLNQVKSEGYITDWKRWNYPIPEVDPPPQMRPLSSPGPSTPARKLKVSPFTTPRMQNLSKNYLQPREGPAIELFLPDLFVNEPDPFMPFNQAKSRPTSAPGPYDSDEDDRRRHSMVTAIRPPVRRKLSWPPIIDLTVSSPITLIEKSNVSSMQAHQAQAHIVQTESSKVSASRLLSLPYEILSYITANMDFDDILNLGSTCHALDFLSMEELIAINITRTELKGNFNQSVVIRKKIPGPEEFDAESKNLAMLRGQMDKTSTTRIESTRKRTYAKTSGFRRKALPILFNGYEAFARPDTASDQDIMTEAFAMAQGLTIQRDEIDQSFFKLGNSKYIKSIGRAQVPIKVPGIDGNEEQRWFHVLRRCPVPLILGMAFIEKIRLYTKNKHLLVDCPHNFGNMPTLKWIGSPRGFINFRADGKQLVGCADSGSDLDFMSLSCAKRLGFKIDRNLKTRVKLADGSVVETVGQVHTSSIELSGFDSFEMSFDILPGLASDVIFSEEFLDQMDAFNTCAQVGNTQDPYQQRLNTLISLGPIQRFLGNFFSKKRKSKALDTTEQRHTDSIEAEIYRRSEANRVIKKMKDDERASAARERERSMCEAFDRGHERCTHCLPRLRGHLPIIPNGSFTPGLENPSLMS
ncbi:hypothetical protein B0J14DRAFT_651270 [Halenospora varia]|nr:hypothetical protein B0J14DRAFT_651270 [Halenospora varia]